MNPDVLKKRIAYCGLLCALCREDGFCDCRKAKCCGKRTMPEGCRQYNCCREKKIGGCWECRDFPCNLDMLAPDKIKNRAFIRFIKANGIEAFCDAVLRNISQGIKYHHRGTWGEQAISGDYDLDTEEAVLNLLTNLSSN